ncbi:MAG: preprotein translocase subunit SecE [Defluviitaleaceae bacterium]|nr:preprotein translocase subunit SecE [Defluviitaleaceae bacterium]
MDDNNKKTGDDGSIMNNATSWWGGIVGEFKRISWPTRPQLIKMTIAAITISGIFGALIFAYDFILGFLYRGLVTLVG